MERGEEQEEDSAFARNSLILCTVVVWLETNTAYIDIYQGAIDRLWFIIVVLLHLRWLCRLHSDSLLKGIE